jgi:hypothetical protein
MQGRSDPSEPAPVDFEGFASFGIIREPTAQDEDVFNIWDINAAALDLFLSVQSQWRVLAIAGFGGGALIWQGLDYSALDVTMRRRKADDALFDDILVMEDAAIRAFLEVRS